jgi:hypothetical protein
MDARARANQQHFVGSGQRVAVAPVQGRRIADGTVQPGPDELSLRLDMVDPFQPVVDDRLGLAVCGLVHPSETPPCTRVHRMSPSSTSPLAAACQLIASCRAASSLRENRRNRARRAQLDFPHFRRWDGYGIAQKMSSEAMNLRAWSRGRMVRPNGPAVVQRSFHSDQ